MHITSVIDYLTFTFSEVKLRKRDSGSGQLRGRRYSSQNSNCFDIEVFWVEKGASERREAGERGWAG